MTRDPRTAQTPTCAAESTTAALAKPIAYIESSRQAGASASKLNRDLCCGKAAILKAAQRQGMSSRELAMLKIALDSIPGAKTNAPEIRLG